MPVEFIAFTIMAILCCIAIKFYVPDMDSMYVQYPVTKIGDVAHRNLFYVGTYDNSLRVSVKYWIYSMSVRLYEKLEVSDKEFFLGWNTENNHDPEGIIESGIYDGYDLFMKELNEGLQKRDELGSDAPIKFTCDSEYDYHVYPGTFSSNEYIDPDALVRVFDKKLEVEI